MPFEFNLTFLWLILAIVLALIELSTTTLVSIWFVVGSLFAFGTSFITDSWLTQTGVFLIVSGICLIISRPLADKWLNRKAVPTNMDRLIGEICIVTEDIKPDRKGRVKTDGLTWMAESEAEIEVGKKAVIRKISGVTLIVEPLNQTSN